MKATAVFDMVSFGYTIDVPDGATQKEMEQAAYEWLDEHLEEVYDDIKHSEIWLNSIEKEE